MSETTKLVQDYYGKVLQSKKDLKTNVCCSSTDFPEFLKSAAAKIHPEVVKKCYGCGTPIPHAVEGCTVLDLGCGAGRDAFILSALVGEKGRVIGVDMTSEQLATACQYKDYHADLYGYSISNVEFVQGHMEELDLPDESVDLVVSNCVFNLSPNKEKLFAEVFRVLKQNGELYFSDVFASQDLDPELQKDEVLLGECLAGALCLNQFDEILSRVSGAKFSVVNSSPVVINNPEIRDKFGAVTFDSITIRVFKHQAQRGGSAKLTYLGGITGAESELAFDLKHIFYKNQPQVVQSPVLEMLTKTRFAQFFREGC